MGFLRGNIFEPVSRSFLRGPARVLVMDPEMYELVEVLDDIIVLSEEPWKFDVRPGVKEIGTCMTGVQLVKRLESYGVDQIVGEIRSVPYSQQIVKMGLTDTDEATLCDLFQSDLVLIAMMQKPDEKIRAVVFEGITLLPFVTSLDLYGFAQPLVEARWYFRDGKVIDQIEAPESELFELDD